VRVQRLAWLGTRTDRFGETTRFFRDLLGLSPVREEEGFTMLRLPSGERDYVEIFGGEDGFEAEHYRTGPVPGFLVSDLVEARAELAAAGVELLDETHWPRSMPGYGWFHFRAPDGNVYALIQEGS
jgi:catechol 2,3-dioxygenase-like lactoylglutathione lyase family enzyme